MKRPHQPRAPGSTAHLRSLAWLGRAVIALGSSLAKVPLVIAAHQTAQCPAGQIAATRIEYRGSYNPDLSLQLPSFTDFVPNIGYTRRSVIVANDYYKEVTEGTIGVLKDKSPGRPFVTADQTQFLRVLPSRLIILETPWQRLEYDELGDPDQRAIMTGKSPLPPENDQRDSLADSVAPLGATTPLVNASYAGIPCELREARMRGKFLCVARVRGREIVLAEDIQTAARRSWMLATTTREVCISAQDFAPPSHVRVESSENLRRQ